MSGPVREASGGMLGKFRDWLGSAGVRLGGFDFEIRHDPGSRTRVRGHVPAAKHGGIVEFFRYDLRPEGRVLVKGRRRSARALELRIAGPVGAGDRQRIRNFLVEFLA